MEGLKACTHSPRIPSEARVAKYKSQSAIFRHHFRPFRKINSTIDNLLLTIWTGTDELPSAAT